MSALTNLRLDATVAGLQSPPIRHAYMTALVKSYAKHFKSSDRIRLLEIGSWAGASTITWAKALLTHFENVEVVCVDPWQPYFDPSIIADSHYEVMDQMARDGSILEVFQHNIHVAGLSDVVRFYRGTSQEILPSFENNTFHIIYIDGAHQYENVSFDLKQAKRLITDNGIICGDDLELQLNEVDQAQHSHIMTGSHDSIIDPKTNLYYHPGVTQAVSEEFNRVNARDGFWFVDMSNSNKIDLDFISKENLEIPEHLDVLPRIIEEYRDFNILKYKKEFCVIRQAIGKVDVFLTRSQLSHQYSPTDLFFCDSLENAKLRIDVLILEGCLNTMTEQLDKRFASLEKKIVELRSLVKTVLPTE